MAEYTADGGTTAYGIAPDANGNGLDPLTHRRTLLGFFDSPGVLANSGTAAGGFNALVVSGRSDLKYHVSDGSYVCTRSANNENGDATDGYTVAYWPGGDVGPVPAGDPSNPRLDVVWIKADDPTQGDADNHVKVGVTTGVPASSPTSPAIPSGACEICTFRVPAGMTKTSSATIQYDRGFATPYGSAMGLLARNVNNYEGPGNISDDGKDYYEQYVKFTLSSSRIIEFRYTATACSARNDDPSRPTESGLDMSCWYVGLQLDGKDIPGGGGQFQVSRAWQQVHLNVIVQVGAGTHTVNTRNHRVGWGENVYFIAHSDDRETYPGRTLEVWDRGISKVVDVDFS